MNSSKLVICVTIVSCLIIIGVPTIYKVIKNNNDKLYAVTNKLIIEAAEKCYYEKKCDDRKITLDELYTKNYLEKGIIDPVSKVVYNGNSYVMVNSKESTFTSA